MLMNLLLSVLIVVMVGRDVVLLVRDRRAYRVAYLTFWLLLGIAHFTRQSGIMPMVPAVLVVAILLKGRAQSGSRPLDSAAERLPSTGLERPRAGVPGIGVELPAHFRPGPGGVQTGEYAMWRPSAAEPLFGPSETRGNIDRVYQAAAGIEAFALAGLLRRLGTVGDEARRVALPEEMNHHAVLGPEDRVFVVSASRQKGIRFHFHDSATPDYRNRVLSEFVAYLEALRRALTAAAKPTNGLAASSPGEWWGAMDRVLAETEARGEPVEAVGKLFKSFPVASCH